MRSSVARRRDIPLIADVAIAIALAGTVTFFIVVMEYRVGQGELTRAELHLLDEKMRVAHMPVATGDSKNQNRENKESKNGKWWSGHSTY